MMALLIPQPKLEQKEAPVGPLAAEKPIMLSCGPVTFPDGGELLPEKAKKSGYFLFRQRLGAAAEVWIDKSGEPGEWVPDGVRPEPLPLAYNDKDKTWQMVLVAIGQKDKHQKDKFETNSVTGYPRYFVRCIFQAIDGTEIGQEGISPQSRAVEIYGAGTRNRSGLALDPEDPLQAKEVRLFLKDQSLQEKGFIAIRNNDNGFEIELAAGGAMVRLKSNGDVEVTPAPSRQVTVSGGLTVSGNLNVAGVLSINGVPFAAS